MLALYARTAGYPTVYEDNNDPEAFSRPWPLSGNVIGDALRHPTRLLRDVSFAISGTSARAAHVGNVVLHLVNGVLLYRVAVAYMPVSGALMAAGLFWLHPVQVESVAYVSSRSDLVAVFFTLLCLLARKHAWLCLGLAIGAVLSKETSAMVLLIPVIESRSRPFWAAWGFITGPIVLFGLTQFGSAPSLERMAATLTQLSSLLTLWVWPVSLSVDHDWALLTSASIVMCLGVWMALFAWAFLTGLPRWSWAIGSIAVFFLPRLVVPLAEGLHEHHLYAPSLALSLTTGWYLKGSV